MPSPLVVDACCILNFAATGKSSEILSYWDGPLWVPEIVSREAIKMDGKLISYEGLTILPLESSELPVFVDLAKELDDGEAATLCLAFAREATPATDDNKAIRIWKSKTSATILGTAELLHSWSHSQRALEVALAIQSIESKARFTLARKHPLYDWWNSAKTA